MLLLRRIPLDGRFGSLYLPPVPNSQVGLVGGTAPTAQKAVGVFSLFDKLILKGCVGGAVLSCCSRIEWSVRFFAGFYLVEDWKDVFVREVFVKCCVDVFRHVD